MDALTRQEYPAMLQALQEQLHPGAAVTKLNERIKKIGKINSEIADWLHVPLAHRRKFISERRKIEDLYATSLRKLAKRPLHDIGGQMGVFDSPWKQILAATEDTAKSHSHFSNCVGKDVELPLRSFAEVSNEMKSVTTMQKNISSLARDLEDAREKNEKLLKKGGKASASRLDSASNRLKNASQQWDVQSAFVFESLQALDERRINYLRDLLTQYQTYEADHVERTREIVERTLKHVLDISTEVEILNWSQTGGVRKPLIRQNTISGTDTSSIPTPTVPSIHGDSQSERSQPSKAESGEKMTLKRMGTILTRRRQSVHSVFRSASPSSKNGFQPFGRGSSSLSIGPQSPTRESSSHKRESDNRLSSLPESPRIKKINADATDSLATVPNRKSPHVSPSRTTSIEASARLESEVLTKSSSPSNTKESQVDSEGYSVPHATNDPISQIEQEISQVEQPQFKLNIQKDPFPEQESHAIAALSSVANTLRSSQVPPSRKSTFRGRRDLRNNVVVQTGHNSTLVPSHAFSNPSLPASPNPTTEQYPTSSIISTNEQTAPVGSDNVSIRSGQLSTSLIPDRHPESNASGLNCSIIETISTTFEGETPVSNRVIGEIALTYNPVADTEPSTAKSHETVKIRNASDLEMLAPNRNFIRPFSTTIADQFTIDLSLISRKFLVGFTYRLRTSDVSQTIAPLLIKSAWKNQAGKLGLVLEYRLNPAFSPSPLCFSNLVLIAHYTGTCASSCQTKPIGTHLKEKLLVYWQLGDVTLDGSPRKAIARFSGTEANVPQPGYIKARWQLTDVEKLSLPRYSSGIGIQQLGDMITEDSSRSHDDGTDPFADAPTPKLVASSTPSKKADAEVSLENEFNNWKEVVTVKKLVSGEYLSK
ncbi:Cytoskeletal protein syp1 [Golovinomyces cichoracearum]|uniref:Cytoskeletal protein syp1 n=1 Tax=Golovinomyces cichoracearum TaxID=62708 RepID=A0A420H6M2_9PEZI|nr:Cytoskeletal protein syp1 [Golovinomyces cichoracearum]